MKNPIKYLKAFWAIMKLKHDLKEENMKDLIKNAAGWLKIISYIAIIISLALGFVDPKIALIITTAISAIIKATEMIVAVTPSTSDDDFLNKVKEILKKYGIYK